ncbi:hypothetical protein AVEN_136076-1, partial [Araneus ventricosus]
ICSYYGGERKHRYLLNDEGRKKPQAAENEQSDREVAKKTKIDCGIYSFYMEDMIRKIHETKDTMDRNRLHLIYTSLERAVTKDDRIQPLMQELQQLARERVGENADPDVHEFNEFSQKGNYGQSITTFMSIN